jgi:hypothetical protein
MTLVRASVRHCRFRLHGFYPPIFESHKKSLNLSRLPVKGPICQGSLLGGHNDVSDGGDKRSIKSLFQTPLSHAGSGVCLFLKF